MSKKFLYLAGILLTIIIGTVLFWYYCCNSEAKSSNMESSTTNDLIASIPDDQKTDLITTSDSDSLNNWEAIRENLNANPMTLYFELNKWEVNLTQDEIQKFEKINDYLMNNPDTKLLITGHSDITGEHNYNVKIGQARADFIKDYLLRNGANEAKIITLSKGPDDPIAENNTSEGRAKNRRAVILIK